MISLISTSGGSTSLAFLIAGDDSEFLFTGTDPSGTVESIADNAIAVRLWDDAGNEILKTTNSGIALYAQSGATLGQAVVTVDAADYPAAWLAIPFGETTRIFLEVKRITAAGKVRTPEQRTLKVRGRGFAAAEVPAVNSYRLLQNGSYRLLQDGGRRIFN